jgi:hypothetical protein
MKKVFVVLLVVFFSSRGQAQKLSLDEIRHQFYLTTLDYKHASPLIEQLNQLAQPNALELAYRAATEAVLAKPGWNIFKKMHHLKNSRKYFRMAIQQDQQDLEIRFLRLAVEHHIPRYLGYSKNIDQDKQVIMDNIDLFRMKHLPKEITDYIITFSIESGIYTEEEVDHVRHALE